MSRVQKKSGAATLTWPPSHPCIPLNPQTSTWAKGLPLWRPPHPLSARSSAVDRATPMGASPSHTVLCASSAPLGWGARRSLPFSSADPVGEHVGEDTVSENKGKRRQLPLRKMEVRFQKRGDRWPRTIKSLDIQKIFIKGNVKSRIRKARSAYGHTGQTFP